MIIPIVKNDYTAKEQYNKLTSEIIELQFELNGGTTEAVLLEAWDVIIATFGVMRKVSSEEQIKNAYLSTITKLEQRKDAKEIEIEKFIEI